MVSYSPWGHKESDMTEQLHSHSKCSPMVNQSRSMVANEPKYIANV